jgi:hypothetical protein
MGFYDNIPFQGMSKLDIENMTEQFHAKAVPHILKKPMPMDVERFLSYDLLKHYDIGIDILDDDEMGDVIEGMYDPIKNKIIFSETGYKALCSGNLRSRFTGGHEGFHGMRHGPQIRAMNRAALLYSLNMHRQKMTRDIPIYQQAEWQANYGAGALLMPRKTLEMILRDVRSGLFDAVHEVALVFRVSEQAAETRINKLKGG